LSQRFSTVFARFERPPAPTGLLDAVGSEAGPADGEWKAARHLRNLPDEVSGILYFGINVGRDTILPRRSIWRSVASPALVTIVVAIQIRFNLVTAASRRFGSHNLAPRATASPGHHGGNIMKRWFAVVLCTCLALPLVAQEKETQRMKDSYDVLKAVVGMPDKGIPRDLLNKAECVIVVPAVKKAAFIVGASYGRGVMTCRSGANFNGLWTAPAFYAIEGGSFGLQAGGQATDFILLIMNEQGAK
jgi:hypothetical protein